MICDSRNWRLLKATATGIRLITPHQLAGWWGVNVTNARRSLDGLTASGFLNEVPVRARKIPAIERPLLRWCPGEATPHFGKLSYVAKERFRELPPVLMTAYSSSRLTLIQFAVRGSVRIKRSQASHELGVTEAFLYAAKRWPRFTEHCWVGESLYSGERSHGEKVEDAHFISPKTGEVILAIEYAGTYPSERFEALHHQLQHKPYWIM